MLPKSFYEAFIFFTWKQEKDYKKRNPQANISYKCRNKTIQWNTRKSSTIEDWKACTWLVNAIYSKELRKSVNAMYYINKAKNQDHIVTTIDAQKALDKIQHHFMKKKKKKAPRSQVMEEEESLKIPEYSCCCHTQEWMTSCKLSIKNWQGYYYSLALYWISLCLEWLGKERNERHLIWNERRKIILIHR